MSYIQSYIRAVPDVTNLSRTSLQKTRHDTSGSLTSFPSFESWMQPLEELDINPMLRV